MSNLDFRRADPIDDPPITVWCRWHSDLHELEGEVFPNWDTWIAEDDDEIVGMVWVDPRRSFLGRIVTHSERRNEGIGTAMMKFVLEKYGKIELRINPGAEPFFEQFNAKFTGENENGTVNCVVEPE